MRQLTQRPCRNKETRRRGSYYKRKKTPFLKSTKGRQAGKEVLFWWSESGIAFSVPRNTVSTNGMCKNQDEDVCDEEKLAINP